MTKSLKDKIKNWELEEIEQVLNREGYTDLSRNITLINGDVQEAVNKFEKVLLQKGDFDIYARFKQIFGDWEEEE